MTLTVTAAGAELAAELAEVAAAAFPLACPPSVAAADIAAFIEENLSAERFTGYLADPQRQVLAVRADGRTIGYAMLVADAGPHPRIELSKFYVLPGHHGSGAAAALMRAALAGATVSGAACVWLGVNRENERAQRFYRKQGFTVTGERSFPLGAGVQSDFVMTCRL